MIIVYDKFENNCIVIIIIIIYDNGFNSVADLSPD